MTINDPQMAINNIHVTRVQKAFMIIYGAIRDNSLSMLKSKLFPN